MATSNCRNCPDTYTINTAKYSPTVTALPKPVSICPSCDGLECLCRPRFFDGQLLSADDLTRLDRYIVGKNRLHNRYLHGWGVVCGLEVVCDPCKDLVTVRQGYALSPCGDDIVVCKDTTVNVCDLITQCRRESSADDCFSSELTDAERGCKDVEEPWVLSICYDEKPSRGITPLRASSGLACCSNCTDGKSSDLGCDCYEKPVSTPASTSRYAPAQCEPSVLCEGFRFKVTKAKAAGMFSSEKWFQGEMASRFKACMTEFNSIFPEPPSDMTDLQQLHRYCCEMAEALRDFFSTHSTYNCQIDEKLAAFTCPRRTASMSDSDYYNAIANAGNELFEVILTYWQYCLCSLLLPPCPEGTGDNCVPLALLKIRRRGCRILSVCNFDARRFAITVPSLSYWLSWAPIGDLLKWALAQVCCISIELPEQQQPAGTFSAAGEAEFINTAYGDWHSTNANMTYMSGTMKTNAASKTAKETFQVFAQAWVNRAEKLDPKNLVKDILGIKDANGQPFLSAAERNNPLATLLANQVAVPLAEKIFPENLADLATMTGKRKAQAAAPGADQAGKAAAEQKQAAAKEAAPTDSETARQAAVSKIQLEEMQAQLRTLQKTVEQQQKHIDSLQKGRAKKA